MMNNRLLVSLISSSAFRFYFDLLCFIYGSSFLPKLHQKPVYQSFLKTLQPIDSAKADKVQPDVKQAEEEWEEEEEEEEKSDPSSFFKFIKTFIVHFSAKRALERHCFTLKEQDVKVSLFHVERSPLVIPAGSWSTMEVMIRGLFSSDPSSTSTDDTAIATKALEIIKVKAKDAVALPSLSRDSDNSKHVGLLATFDSLVNDKAIRFTGGMHSETVLATLGKYFELHSADEVKLGSICEVLLLFICLLFLSEHLSLETTSIRYDICVETMLSSVLGTVGHNERRGTQAIISRPPFHLLSRRIASMASFSYC